IRSHIGRQRLGEVKQLREVLLWDRDRCCKGGDRRISDRLRRCGWYGFIFGSRAAERGAADAAHRKFSEDRKKRRRRRSSRRRRSIHGTGGCRCRGKQFHRVAIHEKTFPANAAGNESEPEQILHMEANDSINFFAYEMQGLMRTNFSQAPGDAKVEIAAEVGGCGCHRRLCSYDRVHGKVGCIGGCSGTVFHVAEYLGIVKSLHVRWVGKKGNHDKNAGIRAIGIYYFDDLREYFIGTKNEVSSGNRGNSFEFHEGEFVKGDLELSGNGFGTRLGYIGFATSEGRKFEAGQTNHDRYRFNSGGACLSSFHGQAGSDVNLLGVVFWKPIRSAQLQNIRYPTLDTLTKLKSPDEKIVTTKEELTFPEIDIPGKTRSRFEFTQWKGKFDKLPYTAKLMLKFRDGSEHERRIAGTYAGVSYSTLQDSWGPKENVKTSGRRLGEEMEAQVLQDEVLV
ncbi:unnamed protein product, partial [Polarella glacialis]